MHTVTSSVIQTILTNVSVAKHHHINLSRQCIKKTILLGMKYRIATNFRGNNFRYFREFSVIAKVFSVKISTKLSSVASNLEIAKVNSLKLDFCLIRES